VSVIAIIGAGFSGTLSAVHLLRASPMVKVVLIDRSGRFGPGLAYSTPSPMHSLNVPAGNMSAFDDDPGHFLRWATERDPSVTTGSFLPRGVYGQYLESVLASERAKTRIASQDRADRLREAASDAVSIEPLKDGRSAVLLATGERLVCDRVVLATGNSLPSDPPVPDEGAFSHAAYLRDPWNVGSLEAIRPDEPVLIVGTGLTMMDVVSHLSASDHAGRILAISRHGLLPRPHRSPSRPPAHRDPPLELRSWDGSARTLVRAMRAAVRQSAGRGTDWRDVVSSIRGITPELWRRMNAAERSRFLARLRSYWGIVRHRAAPETAAAVSDLIASRRLSVRAGRLLRLRPAGAVIDVTFRPRGSSIPQTFRAARVINCLGPDADVRRSSDPLVGQLLATGQIVPDEHALGVQTTEDGFAIGADGLPHTRLVVVGPMRRARAWEATAVPELRRQASLAAKAVVESLTPEPKSEPLVVETAIGRPCALKPRLGR
jgi:uncharacterized NAD(P)/FAD-binding protein YdhS